MTENTSEKLTPANCLIALGSRPAEWHRVADIISEVLRSEGHLAGEDIRFLEDDGNDHLPAAGAREALAALRSLVREGRLEGQGNWSDPPAHPLHLRVRLPPASGRRQPPG